MDLLENTEQSNVFAQAVELISEGNAVHIGLQLEQCACFGELLNVARFRLRNGLKIILAIDRRAPVFAYQSWFKVGSSDEDPARTGFAHLFEHLMFKGTTRHPTGELDAVMEARGSQTNAATWVDWTYYTQALAQVGDNLKTVIDFESDRMVNLIVDEATFRSELEVVKNERRMSVDDSVQGAMSEELYSLVYTEHSYRWPTIGSMAHLETASVELLSDFYRQYYAPNNATVVVVGDLDIGKTLSLLCDAYGDISSQTIRRPIRHSEPLQSQARHKVLHKSVHAPQLLVAFSAPSQNDPTFTAFELLVDILTVGDSARLYRRLVIEDKLVTDVDAFLSPFVDQGLLEFSLQLRSDIDPETVMLCLQEELERVAMIDGAYALTDTEVEKAKNGAEVGFFGGLRDAESCAEALGHFETNFGDFKGALKLHQAYRTCTISEIVTAASTLTPNCRSSVVAMPILETLEAEEVL